MLGRSWVQILSALRFFLGPMLMLHYFHINLRAAISPSLIYQDSMLLCICSVIDHRGHQNVVQRNETSKTHLAIVLFGQFFVLTTF